MIGYLRAMAVAMTLNAVAALILLSVGIPAGAAPQAASPMADVNVHKGTRARTHVNLFGVTRKMMVAAARVARCEEGGNWHFAGTTFDGGIGWTPANWAHFRKHRWPHFMHDASPHMQANALFRFVRYYGIALPDQHGWCSGY
jgi:hypothetical protein